MKRPLLIPLIVVSLFLLIALGFGVWAFANMQDYKDHSDRKSAAAVAVAEQRLSAKKDNEFAIAQQQPLRSYTGPAPYGSLKIKYPKTWSAYVGESDSNGGMPINGYFNPGYVPATDNPKNLYALRVQIVSKSYDSVAKTFQGNIKSGKLKATAYIPENAKSVTGLRLDGQIATDKSGSMVIMPLRDKTLELWTESPSFIDDFNNYILPNFTFLQ